MDKNQPAEPSSPFSDLQQTVDLAARRKRRARQLALTVGIPIVLLAAAGFYLFGSMSDPLRTLEAFPIQRYYDNPRTLEGARFRASLRAMDQIDWSEKEGRLIAFNVGNEESPVVVLVPPELNNLQFAPGERFMAEVLVAKGGMIKAVSMRRE